MAESKSVETRYQFADFTLDPKRTSLVRAGRELKLRPKVYDALLYFVENRGRLIGKEELIQALWADAFRYRRLVGAMHRGVAAGAE